MKLPTNTNHVKVPLSALRITGNVRKNFDPEDIERLALSIRQDGLMNPITVRPPVEDEHGNKTYEVIAGGRRIRAHQWLCDHGDDFAMIECCIRTGDTWTLQMIENIQRTDLSPREKEEAVAEAMANGLTQTQIAEKLCKPISYVSDIVAGMKVRTAADEAGIATDEISTKALSQLRSIPEESLGDALTELAESGGTFREATRVMREYKKPVLEDEGNAYEDTTNVSSVADGEAFDPFEIESEGLTLLHPLVTDPNAEDKLKKLGVFPGEKTEAGGIKKSTGYLFLSLTTWKPSNKLQEELVEFITPFANTALHREQLLTFISFLEVKAENFCAKYPKTSPVKISYPKHRLDASSGHISCQRADVMDSDIFCIYYRDIQGDAMDLVRDLTEDK